MKCTPWNLQALLAIRLAIVWTAKMIFVHWCRTRKHAQVLTHSELWVLTRMLDTHALIAAVDCRWVDCTDWNAPALTAMVMADGWNAQ